MFSSLAAFSRTPLANSLKGTTAIALLFVSLPALAAERTWDGDASPDNSWNTEENWSSDTFDDNDEAVIESDETISVDSPVIVDDITINNATVTVTGGGDLTLSDTATIDINNAASSFTLSGFVNAVDESVTVTNEGTFEIAGATGFLGTLSSTDGILLSGDFGGTLDILSLELDNAGGDLDIENLIVNSGGTVTADATGTTTIVGLTELDSAGSFVDNGTDAFTVTTQTFRLRTGHTVGSETTINVQDTFIDHTTQTISAEPTISGTATTYLIGGGATGEGGDVTIDTAIAATTLVNWGTEAADPDEAGKLTVDGVAFSGLTDFDNSGELDITSGGSLSSTDFTNQSTGTVTSVGGLAVSNGVTNNGTMNIAGTLDGNLTNSGDAAEFTVTANLNNSSGATDATGSVDNESDGEITVNAGATWYAGAFANSSNGDTNAGLTVAATGILDVTSFTNTTDLGTVDLAGTIRSGSAVNNQSGASITVAATTGSLNNGDLTNAGDFTIDNGTMGVGALGNVTNTGTITLDDSADGSGDVQLNIDSKITQNTGGSFTATSGDNSTFQIEDGGEFEMTAGSISNIDFINNYGTFDLDGGSMSNIGTFTNGTGAGDGGAVEIADGQTFSADTVDHQEGTISVGAGSTLESLDGHIEVDDLVTVAAGGTVAAEDDVNINDGGTVRFEGATGSAVLESGNSGDDGIDIASGGALEVTGAGTLLITQEDGSDTKVDSSGDVDFVGGDVTIRGEFEQDAGTLDIVGTVTADLWDINDGTVDLEGTVNGELDIGGDATLNITGDVLIEDYLRLRSGSDLVNELDESNTITLAEDATFRSRGSLDGNGTGTLTINASAEGSVVQLLGGHSETGNIVFDYGDGGTLALCDSATDFTLGTSYANNLQICTDGAGDALVAAGDLDMTGFDLSVAGNSNTNGTEDGDDVDGVLRVEDGSVSNVMNLANDGLIFIGGGASAESITVDDVAEIEGVTTNDGYLEIRSNGTLSTRTLTNDGLISVSGTLAITGNTTNNSGDVIVETGGSVTEAGDWNNLSGGDVDFNAALALVPDGTADRSFEVTGEIINDGDFDFLANSGDTTFTAGAGITNNGDGNISVGSGAAALMGSTTISNAGDVIVGTGGSLSSGEITNTGTLDSSGTLNADIDNSGTANVDGILNGNVTNTDGEFDISAALTGTSGAATGTFDNSGDGVLDVNADFTVGVVTNSSDGGGDGVNVAGAATMSATSFENSGSGSTTIDGTLDVSSTAATAINVTGGSLDANGVIDGNITNAATVDIEGDLDGNVVNSGSGAVFTVTGDLASSTDTAHGTISNSSDGRIDVDSGTLTTGVISNASDGSGTTVGTAGISVQSGTIVSATSFDNSAGTAHIDGSVTLTSVATDAFNNSIGSTLIVDGSLTGGLTNSGDVTVTGDLLSTTVNSGTMDISGSANVAGLNNTGDVTATDADFTDSVVTSGTFEATGTTDLNSNALTFGGGDFDLADGDTGEMVENISTLSFADGSTTTLHIDQDRTGSGAGDLIDATTFGGGTGLIDLALTTDGTAFKGFVPIFDTDTGVSDRINFTPFQLEDRIVIIYEEEYDVDGVRTGTIGAVSSAAASSVSSITMSEAIINTVVNRPSSPFVTGLAFEDENPCSAGTWARTTAGTASVDNGSSQVIDSGFGDVELISPTSSITTDFFGVHGGADFGCFDDRFGGWNLAGGAILGFNSGSTSQDNNELGYDLAPTRTSSSFNQTYAGGYVVAVNGNVAIDVQARVEQTDYKISNSNINGFDSATFEPWDLDETPFSTTGSTISGGVQYFITLNEETGLILVPNAGMGITKTDSDPLTLREADFDSDSVVIDSGNRETRIAFAGATLAQQRINDDGVSARTLFGTMTFYNDLSDPVTSTYFEDDVETGVITTDPIGSFAEASAGWSYIKILEPGQEGGARQFNASIRVDGRFSDDVEAIGVTGQVRWQF